MPDAVLAEADQDGVFPEGFYATTNFPTDVSLGGRFVAVERPEMDVAIRVVGDRAESCPMHRVKKGDRIVVGAEGVRVHVVTVKADAEAFGFMQSAASTERPKARIIADLAASMRAAYA